MVLILSAVIVILVGYVILLRKQVNKINRQLEKRRKENTRQPISLELIVICPLSSRQVKYLKFSAGDAYISV